MLIAKLMSQSSIIPQLLSEYKQRRALGSQRLSKKRRLVMNSQYSESFLRDDIEEIPEIQSEMKSDLTVELSSPDLLPSNYILWEKLMEDDVICESEPVVSGATQLKFVHELEDLIEKPVNGGGRYHKELMASDRSLA